MPESWFASAFALWGSPVTWLELVAVALSLAMVGLNIREIHWGWPLAIVASLLYFLLFWRSRLYGEAGLQVVFAVVALWGWAQWLRGKGRDGAPLRVHRLTARGWGASLLAFGLSWPALGWVLKAFTDTDVPWWDAFPTALSLVGQVLLGRKLLENWLAWIAVNTVSVALFAYKGLWLTAGLYLVFIALSGVGWRAWRARAAAP
ncbi:nicotinamide riboside transporter PnuC [Ramlibacter sp.]|uniref:nicotinamide riboside transporter PnuC n=1 Tax=Ramlibacter sp. TaxID=1917967 RepID=UPI002FCA1394